MFCLIYKITNLLNGKIYIGSHKTKILDDNYMGSGKYLKRAQEKYGLENFIKEILFVFDTPEEMYAKEAEIVNEDFLMDENTYNLKLGGQGGWDYNHRYGYSREGQLKGITEIKKRYPKGTFYGKTHSAETRLKLKDSAKINSRGERNSQYGTRWIYSLDEKVSKKISKDVPLPNGWIEGRKIKFNVHSI